MCACIYVHVCVCACTRILRFIMKLKYLFKKENKRLRDVRIRPASTLSSRQQKCSPEALFEVKGRLPVCSACSACARYLNIVRISEYSLSSDIIRIGIYVRTSRYKSEIRKYNKKKYKD